MNLLIWILTRIASALLIGIVLFILLYYFAFPGVVRILYNYSRVKPTVSHFKPVSEMTIRSSSGSSDSVYYAALYDCRRAITRISGPSPDAIYWKIGIYDHRLQRIRGGHLNDTSIEIREDGTFNLLIQPWPGNLSNVLECGRQRTGLIIYRVFLPADRSQVVPPSIERITIDQLKPLPPMGGHS